MEVKPGYKQTEVGVIPEEWDVRTIGEMFRLINGCAFKPDDWKPSGIPIIRIQNLNDPSAEFNYSQMPVPERNCIEAGDLLFAWSGTLGSSFGARVWSGPSGVLNQHIFKVLMDEQQVTLPFSLLVFARVEEDIAKQAHGFKASFVHVKKSDLVKVGLPLPPLPEQHAIALALSDVDGLLGGLDRIIAKKRDLKQAAMQQLLTGQIRLPGFSGEWEVRCLKTIVETPVTDGPHLTPRFIEDGIPFLSVNNLVGNKIDLGDIRFISRQDHEVFSRKCKPQKGDILLGKAASVGKVAIVELTSEFNIWSPIALIRVLGSCSTRFVYYQLQSVDLICQITLLTNSSSQGNIGMGDIEKLTLRLPARPEQVAIAEVLTVMDAELAALEQRRNKTRDLKQAMMQELLTGRTRLV
jgi:type I restriction enzyme S subunit